MQIVIDIAEDMIKSLEQGNFGAKYNIYDLVGTLMNGTPLPDGAEILTKEAYSDLCSRAADVSDKNVGDLISRQAARDALSHMMDTDGFRDGWTVSRANVDCMLRYLPSVEPERKPGKWLLKIEDWNRWTCSECGFSTRTDIHVTLGYDYCPKCGAPMEVNG